MKTLLEQVKDNSALQVTSTIESILKQKTLEAIEETRKQVAADSFGIDFESTTDKEVNEAIDADLMTKEEEVTEAKEPRKNSMMHSRLVDHGFQYKGAQGKFHRYQNAEGHEIKHQYPTWLGNHSFKHTDPSGKVVWKSPQTGDTEIAHHLDQHFPKKKVSEDYNSDLAKRKADDQASFNRHVATHAASLNTQDREKQKRSGVLIPGVKIGEAEKKSGKKPDPKKVAAWKNDERMPWPKNYTTTATRSPIHDFAEEEIEEDLTYPQITQDESHKKNPFHDELTKHGYKYKDTYHYKGSRKKSNPSFKTHTYEHPSFHDAQVVSFNNGKNHHATVRGQTAHEPKDLKKVLFGGLMKEDEIAEKRDPFGFGKRDLARLGTIDKTIKNQVKVMGHTVTPGTKKHAILMQQKAQADDLQRNEAEQQHHAISKPAAHKPMSPEQSKAAKKAAWQNDERMPWPKDYFMPKHSSPLHSFQAYATAEAEVKESVEQLTEAIPYPQKSKHLADYKKTDTPGVFHHPDGHRIEIDKEKGEIHHYAKGSSKPKTFKNAGDLHVHLMKLHHNFDDKVKQHTIDHIHDSGMGLLHKMGKLDYAHKNHPEGRDHEEDAVNYKAMHKAAMNLTKRERGVK